MKLDEIKAAVDAGKIVHWKSTAYRVVEGKPGHLIGYCPGSKNEHYIGLTHQDGVTMNGAEQDFFVAWDPKPEIHAGDVAKEFPDFPLSELPSLGSLWCDKSWHNDTSPSFVSIMEAAGRTFMSVLWCDWPNPDERELEGMGRFNLAVYDVTGDEERGAYYEGREVIATGAETVDDLILELIEGSPEAAHLATPDRFSSNGCLGVRLYRAVCARAAKLVTTQ